MADIFATLLQAAIYKRAAIMEQWKAGHALHLPGPITEITSNDYTIQVINCSCGASASFTLMINVGVTQTSEKDKNYKW